MPQTPYDVVGVERRWRNAWERRRCFRASDHPAGRKFFNYDSGPFPNGPLHVGHVRTYVLGDMTARYQRLLGKEVLYCTEFDAFGLPNELAAIEAGVSPRQYTDDCIELMTRQLKELGISYDWSRVRRTCDPDYYRWTQWLFLYLLELGLMERREADLNWCPGCDTTLSRMQVHEGACWRCATPVETRRMPQWFVCLSRYSARLRSGLDGLDQWSERSKRLLGAFIGDGGGAETDSSYRVHNWLISRQRSWGTPIPIVYCTDCGCVPVTPDRLPVVLPECSDRAAFVETDCPRCGCGARRETDTLDCFFDDVWCFMACLKSPGEAFRFHRADLAPWMPVDRFHSGLDTFFYLHLHRFLGVVLFDQGVLADPEPIRGYIGHDMVLSGGRKMSKHLGNAVSCESILRLHGADALRVGVLWAGGPQRTLNWHDGRVNRAVSFLGSTWELYARCGSATGGGADVSTAATRLRAGATEAITRVGRFIDEYRPNAALQQLDTLRRRMEDYALHRIASGRLSDPDRRLLHGVLGDFATGLSPFAPHLAEELWAMLGRRPFACQSSWPSAPQMKTATVPVPDAPDH